MKRDASSENLAAAHVPAPRRPQRSLASASLFSEILDWMVAPLLLMWPISIVITYLVAASIANTPFDRALEERTISLGQQVRLEASAVNLSLGSTTRRLLRADTAEHTYLQVRAAHGETVAGDADLPAPPESEPASTGLVQFRNLTFHGERVRVGYLEVEGRDPQSPHAVVQVAETLGNRAQLANEIIKGVMLPQFVILPIAVLLVWFGLSRGVRSLSKLQERIAARSVDDMRPIDARQAPIEVAPLVDAFNQLLQRLEVNVIDQKRFIADAAHQMRTPLAGLRTQAELALRETDPQELQRGLQQLVRSSVRATRLVNQLMALARAETSAHAQSGFELLDLEALARDVMRDWVPVAIERGLDLGFEGLGEPALVRGQPILLRELLKNLLDNALRYTARGGAVTVRVSAAPAEPRITLEVEDNGPGIPAAEQSMVFERFYRVLGNDIDGSGLGLAIVREISRQHQATVVLRDSNPNAETGRIGTIATLTLAREARPQDRQDF